MGKIIMPLLYMWAKWDDIHFDVATLKSFFTFGWLLDVLKDWFFWCIQAVVDLGTWLVVIGSELMPDIQPISTGIAMLDKPIHAIGYLNWIVPMEVVAFCVLISGINYMAYFGGSWALRWAKIIS